MRAGSSTKKQYFNAMATGEIKYRRPASNIKQEQDDDSDTEEPHLGLKKSDGRESQIIHSGHFMVSSPHIEHPPKKGYDFDTVNKQTCQTYHFGKTSTSHLSIDASLTKLFECMTLAYSGKLVSPKWKNFKGLKLLWRDKIRLNNAIWRAWYIQYVEKRENPVCHFVTPLEGTIDSEVHRHAEAIATEGKYWKRRIEIVIREYHKWRTYFKKRLQRHKDDDLSSLLTDEELGVGGRRGSRRSANDSPVPMEMDQLFDMDLLMSEFTDTLFSTLASHQPVAWPNPREIAHAGNADMIQPGLIPLQPNLDFMDTFEPLQDLFHALRQPVFPSTSQTQPAVLPALQLPPDLAPISLDQRLIPLSNTPPITNQSTASAVGPAYSQNYMPLFAGQVASPAHIPAQPLMPPPGPPLPPPYRHQNQTVAVATNSSVPPSSVVTHMAPSTVTPSNAATTFSHGSDFLPSQLQQPQAAQPSTTSLPPHNQSFALPRPIQPSSSTKKPCRVQRIIPAPTLPSSQLILTAPFPGHTSAVIVTPSPMKADVVPTTGLVVASPSVPRVSAGFHILPQTQKSPQLIVPKEEMASAAANSKISTPSTGATCDGRASGQGSPCAQEQAPSPQSPLSSGSSLAKSDTSKSRRSTHISAEQKRRFNINIAFKTLCGMVPTLKSQSNTSNAATLQKTVDYIGKLQQDRLQMQEETRRLKEEIEELNASINMCQEQLPATGVPMTRQRFDHMWEKFEDYVRSRTLQDWKFWIFSVIIKPLFETFNSTVSTTNKKELCETTMQWLECHCTLPILRPMVLGSLRQLSTSTSILSDPSLVAQEARQAVTTPKRYSEQT